MDDLSPERFVCRKKAPGSYMMNITRVGLFCTLLILAASASCLPILAADPYVISVVLPLTGAASFLGKAEQKSIEQAEAFLNKSNGIQNRPVHFVFYDDQSSPQTAVQLATEIVASKPTVVLGSAVVAMCNAMAPLMRRGPVLYCLSPGIYPTAGGFIFTSSVSTRDLAAAQVRFFRIHGQTKLALITSTDASGQDARKNIKELLSAPENKDVQLVGESSFNPSDVSAAAQIQRIKGEQPQALIAWSTGASIGTVFKAIVDAGLDIPVATTDGNMTFAQMRQYADILPKELYIPSPDWPTGSRSDVPMEVNNAKRQFFAAFVGTGTSPDAASTFAWDPTMLVVHALNQIGPDSSADQLRDFLSKLKGFSGINGIYDFVRVPQRGLDENNVVITRWISSKNMWEIVSKPRGEPLTP
jgi:branched-chain amino acid transport system substrate-binding protein